MSFTFRPAKGLCFVDPSQPKNNPVYCGGDFLSKAPWVPPRTPTPRIWWDVFSIPSGLPATKLNGDPINNTNDPPVQIVIPGYFKMRRRFVDYAGYFVIHCHILAHEDRGMMTLVNVASPDPPFSHQ